MPRHASFSDSGWILFQSGFGLGHSVNYFFMEFAAALCVIIKLLFCSIENLNEVSSSLGNYYLLYKAAFCFT